MKGLSLVCREELSALGAMLTGLLTFQVWRTVSMQNEITRFKTAFDFSPTPFFMKDEKRRTIAVNRCFSEAFGISMEDLSPLSTAQQEALWSASPAVGFTESDRLALSSDDVIYTVELLVPPRPDRSSLAHPYTPQEYFVAKRRYKLAGLVTERYGLIGSVISVELMMLHAERARTQHEELKMKSPVLAALAEMRSLMEASFADSSKRFDSLEKRMHSTEIRVAKLANEPDPTEGIATFSDFERPL